MNYVLIIFLFTLDPNSKVGIVHKRFTSLEQCQSALVVAKEKMPLPAGGRAAGTCISADELLDLNKA
jgi:hypothetical protein